MIDVDDMAQFSVDDKTDWQGTAMICVPEAVADDMAIDVVPTVTAKKHLTAGSKARIKTFAEGPAAQILHIGPYAAAAPTIATLHQFIENSGHRLTGHHRRLTEPMTSSRFDRQDL